MFIAGWIPSNKKRFNYGRWRRVFKVGWTNNSFWQW